MPSLNKQQIESFERDGFLSPITVFDAAEAGRINALFESAQARWPDALSGPGRNNAHLGFSFLDELAHHQEILDAVESLLGPDLLICGTVIFSKDPRDTGFVSFHQDVTYMGLEPHVGVSAWIALTPSNPENGCMRMIPGSHRWPLQPHRDTSDSDNILTRGQTIDTVDGSGAVDLVLEPGQMSLHHLRTIHDSLPNRSHNRRTGFVVQSFIPPAVRQVNGTMHVQLARGSDTHGYHPHVARVGADMDSDAVGRWADVNAQWSDILYSNTSHERRY